MKTAVDLNRDLDKYYKTLKINRGATLEEIKSAYRKLARRYHPDLNPRNKKAEARFKELTIAYQMLSDIYEPPVESPLDEKEDKLNIHRIFNFVSKKVGNFFN